MRAVVAAIRRRERGSGYTLSYAVGTQLLCSSHRFRPLPSSRCWRL